MPYDACAFWTCRLVGPGSLLSFIQICMYHHRLAEKSEESEKIILLLECRILGAERISAKPTNAQSTAILEQ